MSIDHHFDQVAGAYAAWRPRYPGTLFDLIASSCTKHEFAWEPGCGSGQATAELAARFSHVVATDPAPGAIEHAPIIEHVTFKIGDAESSDLAEDSVDLVASGQAAHWFDMERFAIECRRVGRPDAIVALWTYDLFRDTAASINEIVDRFYNDDLDGCWDPRRRHVEERYANLVFPFQELTIEPPPPMTIDWSLEHVLGYLRSWSAVHVFQEKHDRDPVKDIEAELTAAWGDPEAEHSMHFPIGLRIGRIHHSDHIGEEAENRR